MILMVYKCTIIIHASHSAFIAAIKMKFILALIASLAIIGLGQSHQFPDFGKGPLHEAIQDIFDLFPVEEIAYVVADYVQNDLEVKEVVNFLKTSPVLKNLLIDFEAIPEVIDLLNYLQEKGIESYYLVNQINRVLKIKELVPPMPPTPTSSPLPTTPELTPEPTHPSTVPPEPTPEPTHPSTVPPEPTPEPTHPSTVPPEPTPEPTRPSTSTSEPNKYVIQRTGGLAGFFKDISNLLNYQDLITAYVDKLTHSPAFRDYINELKSGTLQQIVNKISESNSFQVILNGLRHRHVNVKIVGDVLYLLFNVTVPHSKSLIEELLDFYLLLPREQFADVVFKYINEDKEVREAILFMLTPEYHDVLRAVEALEEFKALVIYLEESGIPIIEGIKQMHKAIGMEDYVPPKLESFIKSHIGAQEVGGGMKAMIKDLYDLLPLCKIDALFKKKLRHSKVFANFIARLAAPEFAEIGKRLAHHETFKQYLAKCNEKGLHLVELGKLSNRIIGLKTERIFVAY